MFRYTMQSLEWSDHCWSRKSKRSDPFQERQDQERMSTPPPPRGVSTSDDHTYSTSGGRSPRNSSVNNTSTGNLIDASVANSTVTRTIATTTTTTSGDKIVTPSGRKRKTPLQRLGLVPLRIDDPTQATRHNSDVFSLNSNLTTLNLKRTSPEP